MSANPFPQANHGPHTLKKHVLRIRNLERRPGGAGARRVFGAVNGGDGDGTIEVAGSADWTVVGDGSGEYTVTIDPPFFERPTIGVFPNDTTTNIPHDAPRLTDRGDGSYFKVVTYNEDGSGTEEDDIGFDFIAMGV
jgi:hypothetical protein